MAEAAALPVRASGWRDTLARFSIATLSSALVSGSHLLVQIVTIRHLDARDIGTLAFLLVVIQFGYSLSNALIATPYAIAFNQAEAEQDASLDFFFPMNSLLSFSQVLICAAIGWAMAGPLAAIAFGGAGGISLLRWFGRATAYARHKPGEAGVSDLVYALTIVSGLAGLLLFDRINIAVIGALIMVAGLLALAPFGLAFLQRHAPVRLGLAIRDYAPVWKRQSAWTLIGVSTTEATSNAHSYIVTLIAGPPAFAPIAVAMLFFRPVNVCITALTQLERPRMARWVASGQVAKAGGSVRAFMAALLAIWALTALLATALLTLYPHVIVKPGLPIATVALAVALCSGLSLIQCLQTPLSVFVQARGAFRPLAVTSMRSCIVGIATVLLLVWLAAPVWSVAGVLLAQCVMMLGIVRVDRRLRAETQAVA